MPDEDNGPGFRFLTDFEIEHQFDTPTDAELATEAYWETNKDFKLEPLLLWPTCCCCPGAIRATPRAELRGDDGFYYTLSLTVEFDIDVRYTQASSTVTECEIDTSSAVSGLTEEDFVARFAPADGESPPLCGAADTVSWLWQCHIDMDYFKDATSPIRAWFHPSVKVIGSCPDCSEAMQTVVSLHVTIGEHAHWGGRAQVYYLQNSQMIYSAAVGGYEDPPGGLRIPRASTMPTIGLDRLTELTALYGASTAGDMVRFFEALESGDLSAAFIEHWRDRVKSGIGVVDTPFGPHGRPTTVIWSAPAQQLLLDALNKAVGDRAR